MTRAAWCLLALLASSLTAVPAARAIPVRCDKSPYDVDLVVVHGNGVFTDLAGAKASLEALRPLVEQKLRVEPDSISYAVAYNQEKGFLASIHKLIKERLGIFDASATRALSELDYVPDWLGDKLAELATERELHAFANDPSHARHVTMYREHLRRGRKVVVIAHSEGNMYANAAYRRLFEVEPKTAGERAFGIVGVATPTPLIAGKWFPPECSPPPAAPGSEAKALGCYTTLDEDKVIGVVQDLVRDTAPGNVPDKTVGSSDKLLHKLVETYLLNPVAREQILNHVAAFVAAFEPLEVTPNDSLISAYLEWDAANADLDLHVYEGLEHLYSVFPESKHGGELEADDSAGPKAEHYSNECAVLGAGHLRFAIGYYAGPGPVNTTLRVKVGELVRSYPGVVSEPLAGGSFHSPVPVATVRVTNRDRALDRKHMVVDEYDVDLIAAPRP